MPQKWTALLLLSVCLTLSAQADRSPSPGLERLEENLFLLVNHDRYLRGLPALRPEPRLRSLARAHSLKMIRENRLDHDFPGYQKLSDRARQAGLRFSSVGENLAIGDTAVMRYFYEQMLASPGHSQNILDKNYTHMGIGILKSGNKYYVTLEFARLREQ